ncbi:MAG: hypothetical protein AAB385_00660 [Planctomycetota bacterium]
MQAHLIADVGLRIADFVAAALVLIAAGCRSTPSPIPPPQIAWQTDLVLTLDDARKSGKPILVVAVIGDIDRQC